MPSLSKRRPEFSGLDHGPDAQENNILMYVNGRMAGLRVYRYSWWVHWRELADYILPRRYKWLITPNQASRGSPINQHILDSTGTLAARNLASGMMSGISSPTRPWFKLKIGRIDSTQTSPISLWLAECERLLMLIFQESNFYNSLAILYFDLVVFGTATMIIYEDFDNVVCCYNPCAGEYFVENNGKLLVSTLAREFTLTTGQVVDEFGFENSSPAVQQLFEQNTGASLSKEWIIGHIIEPNNDGRDFGVPRSFKWREVYWEIGQASGSGGQGRNHVLRVRGYHEQPFMAPRWDLVSNDSYGRSPAMDALPDVRQLQQEVKRKAQAIDKQVNPPMVADAQLKNQPASLLPGGVTYIAGMMNQGKSPGFAPVYQVQPQLQHMLEDLNEVRDRIKRIFYNDLFQVASQYETRSNVTAVEWDMRKAESLVMLGPVLERLQGELLAPAIDRVFAIAARAGVLPPPPQEIQGAGINIEYISMLAVAQAAAQASGIERVLGLAGNIAGIDPSVMDNIDIDYAFDKYSSLMNNDPKMIRSPEQLQAVRQMRQQQQAAQQQAAMAEQLAKSAKNLAETPTGAGQTALTQMLGTSP